MKLDQDTQRSIFYFMKGATESTQLAFVKECFDGGEIELVDFLMAIAEPVAVTIHEHYWENYQDDWAGVVDYEVTEALGETYVENWSVILENNGNDAPSLEHVSHLLHSAMREFLHPDIPWHPLISTAKTDPLPEATTGTPMPPVKPAKPTEKVDPDIHSNLTLQYFMKGATSVMGFNEFVDAVGIGDYEFMAQLFSVAQDCQFLIHKKYLSKYPFLALTTLAYNVAEPLGRAYIFDLRHGRNDLPITELPEDWVENKCELLVLEQVELYCEREGLNPLELELACELDQMLNSEVPGPVKTVLINNQRALRELFVWEDS